MIKFFLDENISGKKFSAILEASQVKYETSQEWGFRGTPDHIWIPEVTAEGLVIVSTDDKIRYNPLEKHAMLVSDARAIVINLGKTVTVEMAARNFVHSILKIEQQANRLVPPWYLRLTMPSDDDFLAGKPGNLRSVELD